MKFWLVASGIGSLVVVVAVLALDLPWQALLSLPVLIVVVCAKAARDRYMGFRPAR